MESGNPETETAEKEKEKKSDRSADLWDRIQPSGAQSLSDEAVFTTEPWPSLWCARQVRNGYPSNMIYWPDHNQALCDVAGD